METQHAVTAVKRYIEDGLCRELNLFRVEVPLIVSAESGVNDCLDRDGSRTPIEFPCGLGLDKRITAPGVQAATKWKRTALREFECDVGEGIVTDMRAVRKDYFLDHDHSAYVDQWDWEKRITANMRNLDFLKTTVRARRRSCSAIRRSSSSASAGCSKMTIRMRCAPLTTTTGRPRPAARTVMQLLRKSHLGEVRVTVWPKELNAICEKKNIHVLE